MTGDMFDMVCPPSARVTKTPAAGKNETSILALAAELARSVDEYRHAANKPMSYSDTLARVGRVVRDADALITAIADAVAESDGTISLTEKNIPS